MAYKNPATLAQHSSTLLENAVNSALDAYYQKHKVDSSKRISVALSYANQVRSPEDQAKVLLQGKSWTANSAHMAEGAKHILFKRGPAVTWELKKVQTEQKEAFAVMMKAWNDAMSVHKLHNYKGGKVFDYPGKDPLHMELPHSRLKDDDPRVIKTLEIYAKATRLEGHKKNDRYENKDGSAFQKNWLKEYDAKLALKKAAGKT
jgi:hypothetical protein